MIWYIPYCEITWLNKIMKIFELTIVTDDIITHNLERMLKKWWFSFSYQSRSSIDCIPSLQNGIIIWKPEQGQSILVSWEQDRAVRGYHLFPGMLIESAAEITGWSWHCRETGKRINPIIQVGKCLFILRISLIHKLILGLFPRGHFPRRTFPLTDFFPDGHFPPMTFPRGRLTRRTFPLRTFPPKIFEVPRIKKNRLSRIHQL
jgi:hypothetical protein